MIGERNWPPKPRYTEDQLCGVYTCLQEAQKWALLAWYAQDPEQQAWYERDMLRLLKEAINTLTNAAQGTEEPEAKEEEADKGQASSASTSLHRGFAIEGEQ